MRNRDTDAAYLAEILKRNPEILGSGFDIHKLIGKLPRPKKGFTLPGYNYAGPYNPLDKQLKFDLNTGEILKFISNRRGKRTKWLWFMMFNIRCVEMIRNVRIKLREKWLNPLILSHGEKGNGAMLLSEMRSLLNKNLVSA